MSEMPSYLQKYAQRADALNSNQLLDYLKELLMEAQELPQGERRNELYYVIVHCCFKRAQETDIVPLLSLASDAASCVSGEPQRDDTLLAVAKAVCENIENLRADPANLFHILLKIADAIPSTVNRDALLQNTSQLYMNVAIEYGVSYMLPALMAAEEMAPGLHRDEQLCELGIVNCHLGSKIRQENAEPASKLEAYMCIKNADDALEQMNDAELKDRVVAELLNYHLWGVEEEMGQGDFKTAFSSLRSALDCGRRFSALEARAEFLKNVASFIRDKAQNITDPGLANEYKHLADEALSAV